MKKILFSFLLLGVVIFTACGKPVTEPATSTIDTEKSEEVEGMGETASIPFFYQYVGLMTNGSGDNGVTVGTSMDGLVVNSYKTDAIKWTVSKNNHDIYGDPVFSYLSNGNWAVTAWSSHEDSRGPGYLLYNEASCPQMNDEETIAIGPSKASGCSNTRNVTGGKSSQVFSDEDGNYLFTMINGEIYLNHISDASQSTEDLKSICVLSTPVKKLSDLDYGESTLILSRDNPEKLLFSDTAVAKRGNGTWVLFVKGVPKDNGCEPNTICELCARGVYRSTSTDLITWSTPEKVVSEASVPEAVTMPDGTVRLYWQDFSKVCSENDQFLGQTAPIATAYEMPGSYDLSDTEFTSYPDDEFETNSKLHYATNGNPVTIPNADVMSDLAACME